MVEMAEKKSESFFIKYILSCASAAVAETGMFKAFVIFKYAY